MIVLFGTRSSYLSCSDADINCSFCKTKGIRIHADVPYFHIFYLPIFPLPKLFTGVCPHCHAEFRLGESSIPKEVEGEFRTPWWTCSGFIIVATIFVLYILLSTVSHNTSRIYTEEAIAEPKQGMVMEVKFGNLFSGGAERYTLLRVFQVTSDSVVITPHSASVIRQEDISHLKTSDFERIERFSLSRKELIKMREDGKILRVRDR